MPKKLSPKRVAQKIPWLVPLRYSDPQKPPRCEVCRDPLQAGMLVAWWRVPAKDGTRPAVHCATCHREKVAVILGRRRRRKPSRAPSA